MTAPREFIGRASYVADLCSAKLALPRKVTRPQALPPDTVCHQHFDSIMPSKPVTAEVR